MEVLQFDDETKKKGWWMVKCANGRQGFVPDSIVELLQSSPGRVNEMYMLIFNVGFCTESCTGTALIAGHCGIRCESGIGNGLI